MFDSDKAKILASLPGSQDGFVAVSRQGKGEVVAIGMVGLTESIGERVKEWTTPGSSRTCSGTGPGLGEMATNATPEFP